MSHSLECPLIDVRRTDRIISRTFATISTKSTSTGMIASYFTTLYKTIVSFTSFKSAHCFIFKCFFLTISKVLITDLPNLTQNLMQMRCSGLCDMTKTADPYRSIRRQ